MRYLGLAVATSHLADMYRHGLGVRRDIKKAAKLYAAASAGGYAPAWDSLMYLLNHRVYYFGDFVFYLFLFLFSVFYFYFIPMLLLVCVFLF
jgi:TPR repeat protein